MRSDGIGLDIYMEEYGARGVSEASVAYTESRLERWGRWLKKRAATGLDRADRRGSDHRLHSSVRKFSIEGDRVRNTEHDAWIRGVSRSAGTLEAEPAALDEGPEGLTLPWPAEAH